MAEIKEFPQPKERPRLDQPADIVPHEKFERRSAERDLKRRNENPLSIDEIFELINDGKITKERLKDFELGKELEIALGWVIDLLETVEDKERIIEQLRILTKDLKSPATPETDKTK